MTGAPAARFAINVLENAAGRLLFLKRSPSAGLGPGLWGFPAGHIEAGESPESCSRREIAEEIGSDHVLVPLRMLGPVRDTLYGGRYEIWLFHYRHLRGEVVLNHEHTAWAWVGIEDYARYETVPGVDQDIAWLGVWPRSALDAAGLPPEPDADER